MLDIKHLLRPTTLTFVSKHHEHDDVTTFSFTPNRPLKQIAGQHGLFFLPGFKGMHIFSLTSAPEENYVMIGTHVRAGSRYKAVLDSLKPGDKMTMFGPIFNFTLQGTERAVFLAQGIGITPFRSMLVHKREQNLPVHISLVHVDAGEHTYQALTQSIADHATYPTDVNGFITEVSALVATEPPSTVFYMSGSPRFVAATKRKLRSLGIPSSRIKKDGFLGY